MIERGVAVDTPNQVSFVPSDISANSIVAISNEPASANGPYHVVRDQYSNMMDVTDTIARLTGRRFQLFKLAEFVPEIIRRSTRDDLVFPLLDFFIGAVDRLQLMEFKRYDSAQYQK